MDSLRLQSLAEGLDGTGTVRLDAAFGAAHGRCRFRHVHLLPVTHQKRLSLTGGQFQDLAFDLSQYLGPSGGVLGVQLIRTARAADMIVTITSSRPNVATVSGGASTSLVLRAGDLVVPISLATSGIAGSAVLTFEFEGERVELLVEVGNPPAGQLPPIVAPVVGVQVQ